MKNHSHAHHHGSLADLLDLDATVQHRYLFEVMSWVQARATERPQRILDIGAGPGAGTVALADRFMSANVVAADISPEMLGRVQDRARRGGLAGRVSTAQLDLNGPWAELGLFDVVWASAALHEFADFDATFTKLFSVLNPGGLIAIAEMDAPPRFLGDEVGDGIEARIHELLLRETANQSDHPDWSGNLDRAGFIGIEKKSFTIDFMLDAGGIGGRYAQACFRRIQQFVAPRLSDSDREMLEVLVADGGPLSLRNRDDLHLRAMRTAWAAHRMG